MSLSTMTLRRTTIMIKNQNAIKIQLNFCTLILCKTKQKQKRKKRFIKKKVRKEKP